MVLKAFASQLMASSSGNRHRRNLRFLVRFVLVLVLLILLYSLVFHFLMLREGQSHTWITGLYWTLTVMSTLGFGDITFHTDVGRLFSIVVLLTGTMFLLILLPFTFIQFFYEPWMRAQEEARTPRRVNDELRGHVLITHHDVITSAVIRRLEAHQVRSIVIVPNHEEAQRLQELGVRILLGELDDPETYQLAGLDRAALLLATGDDTANASIAFTAREVSPKIPVLCKANHENSVDVLELAGASSVLRLEEMMGQALARRALGGDSSTRIIGHVGGLLIAEAAVSGSALVGETLAESRLREKFGVVVAGIWTRGRFEPPQPSTELDAKDVLVLAGEKQALAAYDETFGSVLSHETPVLIIGGGRVGRATARALARERVDFRIIEKESTLLRESKRHVVGDASDLDVLEEAGIRDTPAVIITPHEDESNVYLTVYCRKLRPDVQILARATHERNVGTLHRAGADFVLSYASMGANMVLNRMRADHVLMVAEGLDVFRVHVPAQLAGSTVGKSNIRESTGCSVVAIGREDEMRLVPGPTEVLAAGADLLLIGTIAAQEEFFRKFPDADTFGRKWSTERA